MRFEYTDGGNKDFISLCNLLDNYLNESFGGEENRAEYIQYNKLNDIKDVIVAYDGDIPVGSASFKKYDDDCAEVKRVFIKKEYRGQGIAEELLKRGLDYIQNELEETKVKIQAQDYLRKFYGSFGFQPISETYLEDNIPHVDMLLEK